MGLDFPSGKLIATTTGLDDPALAVSAGGSTLRAQIADMILEPLVLDNPDISVPEDTFSDSTNLVALQHVRARSKPSSVVWRLTAVAGDELLFIASLTLLLLVSPPLHFVIKVASFEFEIWHSKLVWELLALIAWNVAAPMTQTQELLSISNRFRSVLSVVMTLVLMCLLWISLTYLLSADQFTSYIAIPFAFLAITAPIFCAWRLLLVKVITLPRFRQQAVIIGNTPAGETVAKELCSARQKNIAILGYIGLHPTDRSTQDMSVPVLGKLNTLHKLVHGGFIDTIIMAMDHNTQPALFQEAISATQFGISVIPMPVMYETITGKIPVEYVGDHWFLAIPVNYAAPLLYLMGRRIIDIIFGLAGTLLFLLIFPVLAILIHLDSPGATLYSQERLGYRGRKFRVLKFRSMRTDAESGGAAQWTAKDGDPRITRVGRLLRPTHLDELPQVLNILKGDMSLIGPRPERETFVTQLEKTVPFYRCRLNAKPGLTGWAQVKYPYGNSEYDALVKLQYDLYYIKHQSFMLDAFIMIKTVPEVLLRRGS